MKSQSSQTLSKIADTVPITRTTSENQEAFSKSMTTSVSSAISVSNQNQTNRKMLFLSRVVCLFGHLHREKKVYILS